MEDYSSILTVAAAVVPIAHFFYTLGRDLQRMRLDRPRVRVFVATRERRGKMGFLIAMKCVCVCNVSRRMVSVAEVRTSPERGIGVIVSGDVRNIPPGGLADYPFTIDERVIYHAIPTSGEVFVELGTGEVFSVTF